MKKTLIIIGVIALLAVIYGWSTYNSLVSKKEAATAQWQQVETQYQRRLDLIPNLVESVKGAMKQEQAVFTALADARAHYAGATTVSDRAAAAGEVESSLGRLLAVVENYPTLKSSDTVQNLMTQLEGTENRVSVERQRYNDDVQAYEMSIKRFPSSAVASMFGFSDLAYFQAAPGAENAPKVSF
ncbi:MAG: LemA family protein [Candidatus Parcubacteria bacterium]|nr:LemA family protein [Candidatus Parcubacteria bacterium]